MYRLGGIPRYRDYYDDFNGDVDDYPGSSPFQPNPCCPVHSPRLGPGATEDMTMYGRPHYGSRYGAGDQRSFDSMGPPPQHQGNFSDPPAMGPQQQPPMSPRQMRYGGDMGQQQQPMSPMQMRYGGEMGHHMVFSQATVRTTTASFTRMHAFGFNSPYDQQIPPMGY